MSAAAQKDDRVYDRSFSGFPGGIREWAALVARPSIPLALSRRREGPAYWARARRDQGALRRALSVPLLWFLATSMIAGTGTLVNPSVLAPLLRETGPLVAMSYAAAGALALLAALNSAELVARRPFAGPGGQAPLLLASLGPAPAAVAAASLALQHVVAAASLARAVAPGIGRMMALGLNGAGSAATDAAAPPSSLVVTAAAADNGTPGSLAARTLATEGAAGVFATAAPATPLGALQAGPLALDPLAAGIALLASLAAALSARGVGWFCAGATGAQLLASVAAVGALVSRAAAAGGASRVWDRYAQGWLPASSGGSPAAAALLGPVATAAGAVFVAAFSGVSLAPALADDARRPARALPAAMVGSAAATALLYAATALAFVVVVPTTAVAAATTEGALAVLPPFLLGLASVLGAFSGVPALVLGASRVVCGAARHRLLPAAGLGRVAGRRLRSPAAATAAVALAVVPLALLAPGATQALGGLAAVGFLVTQAMVAVAVLLERASDARGDDDGGALALAAAEVAEAPPVVEEEEGHDDNSVWRRGGRGPPPPSPAPPPPPPPPPLPPPLPSPPPPRSALSSPDGRVSIRSPSPSSSPSFDGLFERCFYPDPVWWAQQGPGAVWLPRALVASLVACSCGAGAALSAGAAWPGEALWPLVSVLGFWLVLTASLHVCNVAVARATAAAAAAVAPPQPPPPAWLPPPPRLAPALPPSSSSSAAGHGGAPAAPFFSCCSGGRRLCHRSSRAPNKAPAPALAPGPFRVPGGPWLPSLSLLAFGAAGGACLPPGALLHWFALAGAAALLWLLYGLPATDARETRWAAEDAAEEDRRAAEAEEEGRQGAGAFGVVVA